MTKLSKNLRVFEQKFVKCTTVRTKIPKIRPNLTHLSATLTETRGFTKKKKAFGKMTNISKNLRVF